MRFQLSSGRQIYKNIDKYRINWSGKSLSKVQKKVKIFLKPYWEKHLVYEEMPIPQTRLHCDFVNFTKKIAIEPGGEFHFSYNSFFHNHSRSKYLKSLQNDQIKRKFLELNGFKLIEIHEKEVDSLSLEFFKEKFNINL